jgi:hypothetical protein
VTVMNGELDGNRGGGVLHGVRRKYCQLSGDETTGMVCHPKERNEGDQQ